MGRGLSPCGPALPFLPWISGPAPWDRGVPLTACRGKDRPKPLLRMFQGLGTDNRPLFCPFFSSLVNLHPFRRAAAPKALSYSYLVLAHMGKAKAPKGRAGHKKGPRFFIPRPLLGEVSVFFAYWNNKPKKRNRKTPAQKNRQRPISIRVSLWA